MNRVNLKNMRLFFYSIVATSLFTIPTQVFAQGAAATPPAAQPGTSTACPDISPNRRGAPLCPASGLVPETYPIGAVVVSDVGYRNSASQFENPGRESNFTADVVIAALQGAGENLPVIILPVSEETMTVINNRINALSISPARKQQYLRALRFAPPANNYGYTWQQDYMQAYVNPATGRPMMREVQGYSSSRRNTDFFNSELTNQFNRCGIETGPALPTTGDFQAGFMGGNIEALPGGLCMLGNDHLSEEQYNTYVNRACPNTTPGQRVRTPTKWLSVGHSDEIIKTVRNHSKSPPCDFSIVLASPRKAIELLQQNPNEPFMDFTGGRGGTAADLAQRRVLNYPGLSQLCYEIASRRNPEPQPQNSPSPSPAPSPAPVTPPANGRGVSLNQGIQFLLFGSPVYAEVPLDTENFCTGMTNGEVASLLSGDNDLGRYNRLVQQEMDALRADVSTKISNYIPGCRPDFVEAPDAFFGGAPVRQPDGSYQLPNRRGLSILPNPTNAITINDTIISPEPGNNVFKNYLSEQYRSRGLNPQYVDTFDYAHQGQGNLHCSTNTIHLCSPRGSR